MTETEKGTAVIDRCYRETSAAGDIGGYLLNDCLIPSDE